MKKVRLLYVILSIIICSVFMCGFSNAHSVDLDPEGLITMPMMLIGGKGTISVYKESNYELFYQAVNIQNDIYQQMQIAKTNGDNEQKTLKEEYTKLQNDVQNLKSIYESAKEEYDNAKNGNVSSTELERLKTEYETAVANYNNKVKEYNDKIREYNSSVNETNNNIKELTPAYNENNWISTTDRQVKVDLSHFSGEQTFVIWAKINTSSGETYYDESIYTMQGTKANEVKVTGITLDKNEIILGQGEEYTITANILPADATNKSVEWTSDNEKVVTVSNGKVTAKSTGTATITVTTKDGGFKNTVKVTVTEKKSNLDSDKTNNKEISNYSKNTDTTIANTSKLPNTGIYGITIALIISICFIGIFCYRKYKNYNIK